jgi:molybdate transport system permease protein
MRTRTIPKLSYWVALLFLIIPFLSFAIRYDFLTLSHLDPALIWASLRVSLVSSLISVMTIILIGLPAGYFMAKSAFKFKTVLDALLNLPQVLPPAVIGLLLLFTYGNNGFIGRYLARLGIRTSFSSLAVILTFIFVSLPIFINGCSLAFSKIDPELEQMAALLGDEPRKVFFRITLPLAKKGILVSLLMAWSRGLAEFGATMMFAGNLPGVTQTLPLAIYSALETNVNHALFLSFIMFIISGLVLVSVHFLSKE